MSKIIESAWRPFEPGQRPASDDKDPPYEDGFICGTGLDDPENASWTHEVYDTREEAIAAGQDDVTWREQSEGFQTARIRCEKTYMQNPLSAESACDQAESDEMGEVMLENWQDKVYGQDGALIDELQKTLDQVWSDFEDKHELWSWGIWFDEVEDHAFAPEQAEAAEGA